jgi:ADP-ribosyl-[dinitrogen reductase] hydrolase
MNKTPATLLGLAIGDALGQPFEFCKPELFKTNNWIGEFREGMACSVPLKAGQYTDDTKMAMQLSLSLIKCKKFDIEDVKDKYVEWIESGDLRGIGVQTANALYKVSQREKDPGKIISRFLNNDKCGNGTIMRIAPLAIFYKNDAKKLYHAAVKDAKITHNHKDAIEGNVVLVKLISAIINGKDIDKTINELIKSTTEGNIRCAIENAYNFYKYGCTYIDAIDFGIKGSADETLATALFCFLRYRESFKDAIVNSILIGGDTDTRGAIVGALSGTYLGLEMIPEEYVNGIENSKVLQALDIALINGDK